MPLSICSSNVGQMVLLKYASNTLRLRKISGASVMMVLVDLLLGFSFKYLAGSDLPFLSWCSFHGTLALRTVSSI